MLFRTDARGAQFVVRFRTQIRWYQLLARLMQVALWHPSHGEGGQQFLLTRQSINRFPFLRS